MPDDVRRIVLFTGSRSLADTGSALAWCRGAAWPHVERLRPFSRDTVVVGDARGADEVVRGLAETRHVQHVIYFRAGLRILVRAGGATDVSRWDAEVDAADRARLADPYQRPLVRDEAMVRDACRVVAAGAAGAVVGLHAPWSRTGGTRYTYDRAPAGWDRAWLTCPRELGPGEAQA